MKSDVFTVIAAWLLGVFVGAGIQAAKTTDKITEYQRTQELIKECESTLRRDEHCALIAVRTED